MRGIGVTLGLCLGCWGIGEIFDEWPLRVVGVFAFLSLAQWALHREE